MRTLYHLWLDPGCRKVRLALGEKRLDFTVEIEKAWERRRLVAPRANATFLSLTACR